MNNVWLFSPSKFQPWYFICLYNITKNSEIYDSLLLVVDFFKNACFFAKRLSFCKKGLVFAKKAWFFPELIQDKFFMWKVFIRYPRKPLARTLQTWGRFLFWKWKKCSRIINDDICLLFFLLLILWLWDSTLFLYIWHWYLIIPGSISVKYIRMISLYAENSFYILTTVYDCWIIWNRVSFVCFLHSYYNMYTYFPVHYKIWCASYSVPDTIPETRMSLEFRMSFSRKKPSKMETATGSTTSRDI